MQEIFINIMNNFGYMGVFLLITIENVFPPIPSELILTFGGFMTIKSSMTILGVVIAATLGSVLGAIILYALGSVLSIQRLERLFEGKLGKILRLKKEDVKKTDKWISKYGYKAVFLCRFVPIARSLISIPAGISKMEIKKFLLLTTLGTLIWNAVLVCLGRLAGEAWESVIYYFDLYTVVCSVILAISVLLLCMVFIKKRFAGKAEE